MAVDEVELTMVTMAFDALDASRLQAVLARYVVLSRGHEGCRNIDLALSSTRPDRFVVVQKWDSPAHQQAHFDSADMVEMARARQQAVAGPGLRRPAVGPARDRPPRPDLRPRPALKLNRT